MHRSFWFGTKLEDFLFNGYNVVTSWGLISTCLGLSALAVLYEAMKLFQFKLHETTSENLLVTNNVPNTDSTSLISRISETPPRIINSIYCSIWMKWFVEVLHWSIHVTLGYLLMLAVMRYNGYINIALILGSGIGYYVFGPILIQSIITKSERRHRLIKCNPECADSVQNEEVLQNVENEVNVDINIQS